MAKPESPIDRPPRIYALGHHHRLGGILGEARQEARSSGRDKHRGSAAGVFVSLDIAGE